MGKITLCPLTIVVLETTPIDAIELKFFYISMIIEECKRSGIQILISKNILERIYLQFPWSWMGQEERMKQMVIRWRTAILDPLYLKHSMKLNGGNNDRTECEMVIDNDLSTYWVQWLQYWYENSDYIKQKSLNGIIKDKPCIQSIEWDSFIIIRDKSDLKYVKYPWFLKYNIKLPAEGDFPFYPPIDWKTRRNRKGINDGYIDIKNREWVWDRKHKDHWDVQLNGNMYQRVTSEGKLLN